MKKGLGTVMLAALLGLAMSARAEMGMGDGPGHGPGMGPGGGPHGDPGAMLKQLDLSKEQQQKIKGLRRARRDKAEDRMEVLQAAHEEMRKMLGQADRSAAYTEKLRAKHKEVQALMAEQAQDRFEGILELRSVLTDAQLKKFMELREQKADLKGKGRGRGRGQGPGARGPADE